MSLVAGQKQIKTAAWVRMNVVAGATSTRNQVRCDAYGQCWLKVLASPNGTMVVASVKHINGQWQ